MTDIDDLVKRLHKTAKQYALEEIHEAVDALEAQAKLIEKLSVWEKEIKEAYFQLLKSMGFEHINQFIDGFEQKDKRIAELEAALDSVLIGGNHLAQLIDADHPLHTASHNEALVHYGAGDKYEIWCCWRAMMHAGPILNARTALNKTK